MSNETIRSILFAHADRDPDRTAIVASGCPSLSFAALASHLDHAHEQLRQAGVEPRSRVGIVLPRSLEAALTSLAVASHAIAVPLNPSLVESELRQELTRFKLDAIVVESAARFEAVLNDFELSVFETTCSNSAAPELRLTRVARRVNGLTKAGPHEFAAVFKTSGTTGVEKLVPVSEANLIKVAEILSRRLTLTARDRCASVIPLYYNAGLKTSLFGPLLSGSTVALPFPNEPSHMQTWLADLNPTWILANATYWQNALDVLQRETEKVSHDLRFVYCGASVLPERLRTDLEAQLAVPVLETYGATEAGIVAMNPPPPAKRKPGTVGLTDENVVIRSPAGDELPRGEIGEIVIGGKGVTPGYLTDPDGLPSGVENGWWRSGDLGVIDEEGFLTVVGRIKEIINRGGEKVIPPEIEAVLLKHPCVKEASVFGVPHPRLGEIVGAAVVLTPGSHVGSNDLLQFMRAKVSEFKIPRHILVLDQLPQGQTGKVSRRALAEMMVNRARDRVAPRNDLERMMAATWEQYLGHQEFGVQDDFFELGGDSLQAVEMLVQVEGRIGAAFPNAALGGALTIDGLAQAAMTPTQPEHELITKVQDGAQAPFFFCHGEVWPARGMYAWKIAKYLNDTPMFLLHPYTRDRKNVFATMEELAEAYIPHIQAAAPSGPVRVGGFCNGGLLAWEIAHQLTARGREVQALVLLETMSLNAQPANAFLGALIAKTTRPLPARRRETIRSVAMRTVWTVAGRQRILRLALSKVRAHGLTAVLDTRNHQLVVKNIRNIADQTGPYIRILAKYVPQPLNTDVLCVLSEATKDRPDHSPRAWERLARRVSHAIVAGDHDSQKNAHIDCLASTVAGFLSAQPTGGQQPRRDIQRRKARTGGRLGLSPE